MEAHADDWDRLLFEARVDSDRMQQAAATSHVDGCG